MRKRKRKNLRKIRKIIIISRKNPKKQIHSIQDLK